VEVLAVPVLILADTQAPGSAQHPLYLSHQFLGFGQVTLVL
jgi:hypothetical protein